MIINGQIWKIINDNKRDVVKSLHKIISPYEWLQLIGKERIQAFQDAFAKSFKISLCLLDTGGSPLTVWSNSTLFCHYMIKQNRDRCLRERNNAFKYVIESQKSYIIECYMGLLFFICPVFYGKELICLAYGGGVLLRDNEKKDTKQLNYGVPDIEKSEIKSIINLLGEIFNLINPQGGIGRVERKPLPSKKISFLQNKLSRREFEIAGLIIDGRTNKEISDTLFISEKTVKTHVSNILAKLEMKDRMQLVVFCRQNNLL